MPYVTGPSHFTHTGHRTFGDDAYRQLKGGILTFNIQRAYVEAAVEVSVLFSTLAYTPISSKETGTVIQTQNTITKDPHCVTQSLQIEIPLQLDTTT